MVVEKTFPTQDLLENIRFSNFSFTGAALSRDLDLVGVSIPLMPLGSYEFTFKGVRSRELSL